VVLVLYCSTIVETTPQGSFFFKYKAIIMWSSFFFYSTEIVPISKFLLSFLVKQNEIFLLSRKRTRTWPTWFECTMSLKSKVCISIFHFYFFILRKVTWGYLHNKYSLMKHRPVRSLLVELDSLFNSRIFHRGVTATNVMVKRKKGVYATLIITTWLCWACVVINILRRMWIEAEERVSRCYNFF
jgi:hypothetical protein